MSFIFFCHSQQNFLFFHVLGWLAWSRVEWKTQKSTSWNEKREICVEEDVRVRGEMRNVKRLKSLHNWCTYNAMPSQPHTPHIYIHSVFRSARNSKKEIQDFNSRMIFKFLLISLPFSRLVYIFLLLDLKLYCTNNEEICCAVISSSISIVEEMRERREWVKKRKGKLIFYLN